MKIKCFYVEEIPYKNKETGANQTMYKVWFMSPKGLCWLMAYKPVKSGDEVELSFYPTNSTDVRENMKLGLKIV